MTTRDKVQLLELLKLFDRQELNCGGECDKCFYHVNSLQIGLDDCPLLITYDMAYRIVYNKKDWDKKKG